MWPKQPVEWQEGDTLYVSIPFTWNLPDVKAKLQQRSFYWQKVIVGGPAVHLMPHYFDGLSYVSIGRSYPGILQKVNPQATRTTTGCTRQCQFCGVPKFDGKFQELENWPNLPIICDNNLLAASLDHYDRVINRLVNHTGVDFNQGLDARLLTSYHAQRLAEIPGAMIRLSLDTMRHKDQYDQAVHHLFTAGIPKSRIRTYALIGYNTDPSEAWQRCQHIEKQGIKALPMWYHPLDTLTHNPITPHQQALGWSNRERIKIMGYYYKHRLQ